MKHTILVVILVHLVFTSNSQNFVQYESCGGTELEVDFNHPLINIQSTFSNNVIQYNCSGNSPTNISTDVLQPFCGFEAKITFNADILSYYGIFQYEAYLHEFPLGDYTGKQMIEDDRNINSIGTSNLEVRNTPSNGSRHQINLNWGEVTVKPNHLYIAQIRYRKKRRVGNGWHVWNIVDFTNSLQVTNCICAPQLTFNTTYSSGDDLKFEAAGLISSTSTVETGAKIKYDSGSEIALQAGFISDLGSDFHAYIDGCGNLRKKSSSSLINEVNTQNTSKEALLAYPNPSSGNFNINVDPSKYNHLIVQDVIGKVVQKVRLKNEANQVQLNLSNQPNGIYFITASGNGARKTIKISKQNR